MAGNNSIRGDETITFTDNMSFDGTERGGKLTTNGQLWIGCTTAPHVRKGNLTSIDGSLTISTANPGTIDLSVTGSDTTIPAFLGTGGAVANVTGNSGVYTLGSSAALTEVFDQDSNFVTSGTFTAPITGLYSLNANGATSGNTILVGNITALVTSNRTYSGNIGRPANATNLICTVSVLADMDAADTCTVTISGLGEAANTSDISPSSFFSGFLAC